MQYSENTANVKAPVFSISRLRMGTDGEGITTLSDVQLETMQEEDNTEMLEGDVALPDFDILMGDVAVSYDCSFAATVA